MNMFKLLQVLAPVLVPVLAGILLAIPASPAHAVVLKIATISPDGSSWMTKFRQGAAKVAEATENRVRFKFYPGGVMGNDKAVLRKIRIGQLHGGAFSGGTLARYAGEAQLYSLPLKFNSLEEVDYVRKHMDTRIMAGFEKGGFVTFGLADGGFAYIMSNAPVDSIESLRRQKVWTPAHDQATAEALHGFGIKPIALPIADVRTGLQTGLIDTVAISPVAAIVLQWHTQVKYLTKLPMAYLYGILAVDAKAFARIAPEDQQVVKRIMGRIFQEMDQMNRQDNQHALDALRRQGVEFITPPTQSEADWKAIAADVSHRLIRTDGIPARLVETMERHLADFRNGTAH